MNKMVVTMEDREPSSKIVASRFVDEIIQKTTGEIRTFLDEMANGTSNYRSLHNLTEQVEHQYHGRFLIELIQNAHDALFEEDFDGDQGRLEIIIAANEEPFGAIYVANDGKPFSDSNFQSLSKFGQSDKDPEKHIGNKGIGFRSVLEITKAPEIYSREKHGNDTFNGYCFRFDPDLTERFQGPILELLHGNDRPKSPLNPSIQLIEWGEQKLHAFRKRCLSIDNDWLLKELSFLSPYLLPTPVISFLDHTLLQDLESKGFSTVIKLPFLSESTRDQAISEVERLDENTVLFLDRVNLRLLDKAYRPDQGAYGLIGLDENTSSSPRLVLQWPDLYTDWERNKRHVVRWQSLGNPAGLPVRIDLYQIRPRAATI